MLGPAAARAGGRFDLLLACAGHPAPIVLRAGGEREPIEPEGRCIGVATPRRLGGAPRSSSAPATRSLLYTDGVTEASRSEPLEAADLAALLPPLAARDAEALADRGRSTSRARAAQGRLRDDVAIIARERVAAPRTALEASTPRELHRNVSFLPLPGHARNMIGILLTVLVAALVYILCVALGLPAIIGIVAAILVLLAGFPAGSYGRR